MVDGREQVLNRRAADPASLPLQTREAELSDQYETVCESAYSEAESAAVEVLDLPLPSYFRSRSHSYLRAIQAGCSQEEDMASLRSLSPPPASSISGSRTLPSNSSKCHGVCVVEEPGVAGEPWHWDLGLEKQAPNETGAAGPRTASV